MQPRLLIMRGVWPGEEAIVQYARASVGVVCQEKIKTWQNENTDIQDKVSSTISQLCRLYWYRV